MISFFLASLRRAFNSIYVSLWCHWSVSRYQFRFCNWTEAEKAYLFSTVADFDFIINFFMLCHGMLHWNISHCLKTDNGVWKIDKYEAHSARRCCLWCTSTFNECESDGEIIWRSKDTEKTRSSLLPATFLCAEWKWHMQVKTKKAVINDYETLITLDFYAFYSKTRAGKSREFSIIFISV